MEYLNKFRSTVSSTVSSVAQQVSQSLPGNPIFREYEVQNVCVASAGPALSWKIYSATKNTTKQAVSIWLFEKKQIDKWPKAEKEAFPELLKRGVNQLTRLRHPRILTVDRTLEESRDNFAFCTEPVFTSLANAFGDYENVEERPKQTENLTFSDIEIRHGLFQLSEALAFLHNDAKIFHGNLCPSSIIVNGRGAWKLCGFEFCVLGTPNPAGKTTFEAREYDRNTMSVVQPTLDFAAPELINGSKCDVYVDIFSLGMLGAALFNSCKPTLASKNMLDTYRTRIDALNRGSISDMLWFKNVPQVFGSDLKACLHQTPELRPDAYQLTKIGYFDDPTLKTLNYLESLMQMDNSQKMQFFKGLPQILDKFPNRPLLQKIMPCLADEFNNAELVPFVLPSIFFIAEQVDNNEFSTQVFPALLPVFRIQKPYQVILLLLQKMPLLLKKTPETDIKKHVLPLIYNSVCNENPRIQELCLAIVPTVGKLIDRDAMKTQLLPKLLKLVLEGSVLSLRVQALLCIGKLLPTLEPWMVSDQILPALPKINSREPGILMAVLGIMKLAHENERFGISREQCARTILPFLISNCVENTLNLNQFEQFMFLTKTLLEKVETEQRSKLQQLGGGQEEQIKVQDFNDIFNQAASGTTINSDVSDLFATLDRPNSRVGGGQTPLSQNAPLSLEEKKRLAAEQEFQRSQRSTPTLGNMVQSTPTLASMAQSATPTKSSTNTALNNDDFDLFGLKPSGSSNGQSKSSALDMFDPFPASRKPAQSSNNLFAVNSTFGSLPQPPTSSNPINRGQPMVPQGSGFASFSNKPNTDPFDNLFSLKSAVQNPGFGPPAMNTNSAAPVTKKNDPLDFLN